MRLFITTFFFVAEWKRKDGLSKQTSRSSVYCDSLKMVEFSQNKTIIMKYQLIKTIFPLNMHSI